MGGYGHGHGYGCCSNADLFESNLFCLAFWRAASTAGVDISP